MHSVPIYDETGRTLEDYDASAGRVIYTYQWDNEKEEYYQESGAYVPYSAEELAQIYEKKSLAEWQDSIGEALCALYEAMLAGGE